jgi:hypothetical protein
MEHIGARGCDGSRQDRRGAGGCEDDWKKGAGEAGCAEAGGEESCAGRGEAGGEEEVGCGTCGAKVKAPTMVLRQRRSAIMGHR